MKTFHIAVVLFALVIFASSSWAVSEGMPAPPFHVVDGNDRPLDLRSIKGRVVVGFYENKDCQEKNQPLKKMLRKFDEDGQKNSAPPVQKLAVVDSSYASVATRWIWKRKMLEAAEREKTPVYGDWDGSMKKAYAFPSKESIFFIIDKKGTVRYAKEGIVPAEAFERIKGLIRTLNLE